MRVKISEVWNGGSGGVRELAVIETTRINANRDIRSWIRSNRPDLSISSSINSHGFHAIEEKYSESPTIPLIGENGGEVGKVSVNMDGKPFRVVNFVPTKVK